MYIAPVIPVNMGTYCKNQVDNEVFDVLPAVPKRIT